MKKAAKKLTPSQRGKKASTAADRQRKINTMIVARAHDAVREYRKWCDDESQPFPSNEFLNTMRDLEVAVNKTRHPLV